MVVSCNRARAGCSNCSTYVQVHVFSSDQKPDIKIMHISDILEFLVVKFLTLRSTLYGEQAGEIIFCALTQTGSDA